MITTVANQTRVSINFGTDGKLDASGNATWGYDVFNGLKCFHSGVVSAPTLEAATVAVISAAELSSPSNLAYRSLRSLAQ